MSAEEFAAAHRGQVPGRRRGRDLLSGHVRCGLCHRVMTIDHRDDGRTLYRCRHRGQVCRIPRRPTGALLGAALLGLQLVGHDAELQTAIRTALGKDRAARPRAGARSAQRAESTIEALLERRRKLLRLHYDDKISAELFAQEEGEVTRLIEQARTEADLASADLKEAEEATEQFERLSSVLASMDLQALWKHASTSEQRQLLDELVDCVIVQPDHIQVKLHGAPTLNVSLAELGLRGEISGVEGGT